MTDAAVRLRCVELARCETRHYARGPGVTLGSFMAAVTDVPT
jgi:hypothetical protein